MIRKDKFKDIDEMLDYSREQYEALIENSEIKNHSFSEIIEVTIEKFIFFIKEEFNTELKRENIPPIKILNKKYISNILREI